MRHDCVPTGTLADEPIRGLPTAVEYRVRDARITDVERITALLESAPEIGAAEPRSSQVGGLLRQLVYLPQAALLVVEQGRKVVGVAVVALRASIRMGGMVGTLDVLVAQPGQDNARIEELLLSEALRSARNKGCVVLEAARPAHYERSWQEQGFRDSAPRIFRTIEPARAAT